MIVSMKEYEMILIEELGEDKFLKISSKLTHELIAVIIKFLKGNVDFLSWKPEDMLRIDLAIIFHKLNNKHTNKPIQ